MSQPTILTIDLNFQNKPGTIGVYLLPHENGAILIESGPASTIPIVIDRLHQLGYSPSQITDIFLTHIHFDHAGAAGWWAQQGARIHVHPNGAHHLINPEKLVASATRIYGSQMDSLWGIFSPVPENRLNVLNDDAIISVSNLTLRALDVPGHANHHMAYLVGDACFTGDVGGIRVHDQRYISLPMPPPDLHIDQWRSSIHKLQSHHTTRIIPTHFGIYEDADWHLQTVLDLLEEINQWIETTMPQNLTLDILREKFIQFENERSAQAGLGDAISEAQQTANPSIMSADGIFRYWYKTHQNLSNQA